MTKFYVEAMYHTGAIGCVDFPEGKSWDDVADWHVKWDTLHVRFKEGSSWFEFGLNSDSSDGTDWKRPSNVSIYSSTEGGVDYDFLVDEQ